MKTLRPVNNEKGMVLVVALLIMSVLVLLGSTAVMESTTDLRIAGNYKTNAIAFYTAEAGLERARGKLRADLATYTLSQLLGGRVGSNGVLSNSTDSVNFFANGIFVTDDVVYSSNASFGGGSYYVYLTNDAADGVTATADTNRKDILRSFGHSHHIT